MSDHWPITAVIYETDRPHLVYDILVERFNLASLEDDNGTLLLGRSYRDDETSALPAEIVDEIMDLAPNTSFECFTEPAYEWMGSGAIYTPDLGCYHFICDADGTPHYSRKYVMELLTLDKPELEEKLGIPWFNRIQELARAVTA